MGNENDGGPYSQEWSVDHNREVDRRFAAINDRDKWIRETRNSKLSPDELRRKAFLMRRDG